MICMADKFGIYDTSTGLWISSIKGWEFGDAPYEWTKITKASNVVGTAPSSYRKKLAVRVINNETLQKASEYRERLIAQQESQAMASQLQTADSTAISNSMETASDSDLSKLRKLLNMSPRNFLVLMEYADILSKFQQEIYSDYSLRLRKADGKQQDYLHLIENEDLTDAEKAHLFDEMKDFRHERREIKNVLAALDVLKDGGDVSKKADSLRDWTYTPRQSPDMFPTESARYKVN